MEKEYDVVLTITHVRAESEEQAISIAKGNSYAVYNAIGEAQEIKN